MTSTVNPPVDPGAPARVSRRRVLGWGAATAVVAGTGLLSYRAYDTAVLDPGGGPAHAPWRDWRDVPGPRGAVAAAILAASPHNTQPWEFAVTDRSIDVFTDPRRHTGSVDPFGRERYAGMGCALENLVLACAPRGLSPAVTLLPDGPAGERVAHVELTAVAPRTDPLYAAIDRRHTNRGPYAPTPVPAAALAALGDPDPPDGLALHWIADPRPRAALGELLVDAAEALVADEQLMAAAAPPWLMAIGAASGTSLVLAAWLPARTGVLVALVLLGTAPLAVAGWFAIVPVLVAVVALPIAATVLRSRPSTEPVPNTGKDV